MKYASEPTYAKYITGDLKRFDERNTGFSRGAAEGDLYTLMHEKSVRNMERMAPGTTASILPPSNDTFYTAQSSVVPTTT